MGAGLPAAGDQLPALGEVPISRLVSHVLANRTESPRPGVDTTRIGGHKGSAGDFSLVLPNNNNTVGRTLGTLEASTPSVVRMS